MCRIEGICTSQGVKQNKMTEDNYAIQRNNEEKTYELAQATSLLVKRVQLRGFPKGDLYTRLDPEYRSFRDLALNQNN